MTDTIPVPRAWLERLVVLSNTRNWESETITLPWQAIRLIGYASSAEALLTNGEKGKDD